MRIPDRWRFPRIARWRLAVAFVLLGIIGLYFYRLRANLEYEAKQPSEYALPEMPEIGQQVALGHTSGYLALGVTLEDWKEIKTFQRAKDKAGLEQMLLQGRLVLIESGTRALTLDRQMPGWTEIFFRFRLVDGAHKGQDCWIGLGSFVFNPAP